VEVLQVLGSKKRKARQQRKRALKLAGAFVLATGGTAATVRLLKKSR
jgi:hypothetical protein